MLAISTAMGQTVRVTTWNVAGTPGTDRSTAALVSRSAERLKTISADVILLRNVSGWKMGGQIAEALKPVDYRVVACSAFRDANGTILPTNQVAILSRHPAYFSWWETFEPMKAGATNAGAIKTGGPKTGPAGYAFAAVQIAGHSFAFCAVEQRPGEKAGAELVTARQGPEGQILGRWLEVMASFRAWTTNRIEGYVAGVTGRIGSDAETGRRLRAAGFVDPLSLPGNNNGGDILEGHLVPNADAAGGLLLSRWPVTCEFDFRPAPIVVVAEQSASAGGRQAGADVARNSVAAGSTATVALWAGGGLAFVLFAIVLMLFGIRRKLARLEGTGALLSMRARPAALGYNVAIAPSTVTASTAIAPADPGLVASARVRASGAAQDAGVRQGVITHLAHWLKQVFVQRLLSDRQKLLTEQQVATMKVLAVDERLSRLELKIQEETASYEKQIEQLSRELLTAREENLELIRSQIKLLKSEMESARNRILESETM